MPEAAIELLSRMENMLTSPSTKHPYHKTREHFNKELEVKIRFIKKEEKNKTTTQWLN